MSEHLQQLCKRRGGGETRFTANFGAGQASALVDEASEQLAAVAQGAHIHRLVRTTCQQ